MGNSALLSSKKIPKSQLLFWKQCFEWIGLSFDFKKLTFHWFPTFAQIIFCYPSYRCSWVVWNIWVTNLCVIFDKFLFELLLIIIIICSVEDKQYIVWYGTLSISEITLDCIGYSKYYIEKRISMRVGMAYFFGDISVVDLMPYILWYMKLDVILQIQCILEVEKAKNSE